MTTQKEVEALEKKKKQLESDIASNTAVLNSTIETIAEKEKYIASLTDKEKLLKEFIEIEKQEFENHKNATLQSLEQREKELKQSESNYIKESFEKVEQYKDLNASLDHRQKSLDDGFAQLDKEMADLLKGQQELAKIELEKQENQAILDQIKFENQKAIQLKQEMELTAKQTAQEKTEVQELYIKTDQNKLDVANRQQDIDNKLEQIAILSKKQEEKQQELDDKEKELLLKGQELDKQAEEQDHTDKVLTDREYNIHIKELDIAAQKKKIVIQSKTLQAK